MALLDATKRLVTAVVAAQGSQPGAAASELLAPLLEQANQPGDKETRKQGATMTERPEATLLQVCDLREVRLLEQQGDQFLTADLTGVKYDDTTQWPWGFAPPAPRFWWNKRHHPKSALRIVN